MTDKNIKSHENLFAIDIDGTLLNAQHQITPRTSQAIQTLKKHAHISLVSARPLFSVLQIARSIGLEGPMAALNGAIISNTEEKIYLRQPLLTEEIENIIQHFGKHSGVSLNFYSGMEWIVSQVDERVEAEAEILGYSYNKLVPPNELKQWTKENPVEKILILHNDTAKKDVDLWCTQNNASINMAYSKTGYFEITSASSDKASALQSLADHYNLHLKQTIAIGDGHVDIPMLQSAGRAIVMKNSANEILALGDQIIGHHNEEGLAHYLETYISSQEKKCPTQIMRPT